MEILVWVGAVLSLLGIGALIWCILQAAKARRQGLQGAAMKAKLQRVVVVNMGALAVSAIGLMMVVLGVMLA